MAYFLIFSIAVLCIVAFVLLVQIPVMIARGRGIMGSELTTITVLSWFGLIFGVTWVVALVLSLILRPGQWAENCENTGKSGKSDDIADKLEKLHKLKQRGVITQKEFDAQKKKILG